MMNSLSFILILSITTATIVALIFNNPTTISASVVINPINPNSGLVRHFVSWRFLDGTSEQQSNEIMSNYTSLFNKCINPITGESYILSFDAGIPNSMEGFQRNLTQAFIVTFKSVEDRNYFVGRPFTFPYDLFHDLFKSYVGQYLYKPIQDGLTVIDFIVEPTVNNYPEHHSINKPISLPGYQF